MKMLLWEILLGFKTQIFILLQTCHALAESCTSLFDVFAMGADGQNGYSQWRSWNEVKTTSLKRENKTKQNKNTMVKSWNCRVGKKKWAQTLENTNT